MKLLFREILPIELTNSPRCADYRYFASSKIAKSYAEMIGNKEHHEAKGKLVKIVVTRYLRKDQKLFTDYTRRNGNFLEIREALIQLEWLQRWFVYTYEFKQDETRRDVPELAGKTMIEVYEI